MNNHQQQSWFSYKTQPGYNTQARGSYTQVSRQPQFYQDQFQQFLGYNQVQWSNAYPSQIPGKTMNNNQGSQLVARVDHRGAPPGGSAVPSHRVVGPITKVAKKFQQVVTPYRRVAVKPHRTTPSPPVPVSTPASSAPAQATPTPPPAHPAAPAKKDTSFPLLAEALLKDAESKKEILDKMPNVGSVSLTLSASEVRQLNSFFKDEPQTAAIDLVIPKPVSLLTDKEAEAERAEKFLRGWNAVGRSIIVGANNPVDIPRIAKCLENYLKDFPHMRHLLAYNVVYCSLEELDSYWINPPSEKDLANFPMLKLPFVILSYWFNNLSVAMHDPQNNSSSPTKPIDTTLNSTLDTTPSDLEEILELSMEECQISV